MKISEWLKGQRDRLDSIGRFAHFVDTARKDKKLKVKPPKGEETIQQWASFLNDNTLHWEIAICFMVAYRAYLDETHEDEEPWAYIAKQAVEHYKGLVRLYLDSGKFETNSNEYKIITEALAVVRDDILYLESRM